MSFLPYPNLQDNDNKSIEKWINYVTGTRLTDVTSFNQLLGTTSSIASSIGSNSVSTFSGDGVLSNNNNSSGAVTLSLAPQAKNTIFVGPASGSNATPTFRAAVPADFPITVLSASLTNDVSLSNTGTYFDGPQVAQGTSGTWYVSATVSMTDSTTGAHYKLKLHDGTTLIATCTTNSASAGAGVATSLSGYITNPAGNLRISVLDQSSTSGAISYNNSGLGKDSTITAMRIG